MKCKGFLDLLRDSNVNLEVNVTWDTGAEIMSFYKDHMETLYLNIKELN